MANLGQFIPARKPTYGINVQRMPVNLPLEARQMLSLLNDIRALARRAAATQPDVAQMIDAKVAMILRII
jgi:hypothetical protein